MNERGRSKLKCLSLKQGKLFFRQGLASILMLCKQIQPFSKLACGFKTRLVSPFRGERERQPENGSWRRTLTKSMCVGRNGSSEMGQNTHSMPATRAGLRNNLGEQGRSSRARKPQLKGEWVPVGEHWQVAP